MSHGGDEDVIAEDERTLRSLGYKQELLRGMGAFSNFAISLSIICILAGGVTSFHQGLSSVGGAAFGLGWPLVCLFSLAVAATMGQVASSFPTAGGLYHWASILGGKGWGWATAWLNLLGMVAALAAINLGALRFTLDSLGPGAPSPTVAIVGVFAITASQALVNHLGIRLTTRLTDFSGYWIVGIALLLTASMLVCAPSLHPERLVSFTNNSGARGGDVWPATDSIPLLFVLSFLLAAYTITGFDASANTAEETVGAAMRVPRGIIQAVAVSGVAGWVMLCAVVAAIPDLGRAAALGPSAFTWTVGAVLPRPLAYFILAGIAVAQYLCGLAAVTSASRIAYAFARDGGLPASKALGRVSDRYRAPTMAIWTVAFAAALATVYTPIYETMAAVAAILLYISYVLPTALGLVAYGHRWTTMGPWDLGAWYRPLATISVVGCLALIAIGMYPPNEKSIWIIGGVLLLMAIIWFTGVKDRFAGPPEALAAHATSSTISPAS
ncbi:MAG TPA: amino acid permease [Vicinamibacteria bacterium]|nr:amino acid permease [Vicinamibacteria bacterium]